MATASDDDTAVGHVRVCITPLLQGQGMAATQQMVSRHLHMHSPVDSHCGCSLCCVVLCCVVLCCVVLCCVVLCCVGHRCSECTTSHHIPHHHQVNELMLNKHITAVLRAYATDANPTTHAEVPTPPRLPTTRTKQAHHSRGLTRTTERAMNYNHDDGEDVTECSDET